MLYFDIYLFIELEKLFFKPSVWPSGQYFYLFPGARRVLRSGCSIGHWIGDSNIHSFFFHICKTVIVKKFHLQRLTRKRL